MLQTLLNSIEKGGVDFATGRGVWAGKYDIVKLRKMDKIQKSKFLFLYLNQNFG